MRQIFLLRHAKSSWDDPTLDDFDRPLNQRGRKNAARMGKYLTEAAIRPSLILCSSARRTQETYDIIVSKLKDVPTVVERRLYEATSGQILALLRQMDDLVPSVLVIGHNPGLESLALFLAMGRGPLLDRLADKYPTGALATLETDISQWRDLDRASCRLTGFVRPADLD